MLKTCSLNFSIILLFFITNVYPPKATAQVPEGYKGLPYTDEVCPHGPQEIPGRVELAFYDLGGENVAYHDVTAVNEGAKLNHEVYDYGSHQRPGIPAYIAFFRENEGVDISYTKDWADFNHPNKVDPKVNQLYIGWQEDGEWTNYTVNVLKPGKYRIITIYGNKDNGSELWINDHFACKLLLPEDTGNWHYWTQATIGEIIFEQSGLQLLTLKYNKGSNLAFLDFLLVEVLPEKQLK
jgi:hypothetical protein